MTNIRKKCKSTSADDPKAPRLGDLRYDRYCDAFDHLIKSKDNGYYIEAIAILDSLIGDRLASRAGFLLKKEISANETIGRIVAQLTGERNTSALENDDILFELTNKIKNWFRKRNQAIHENAKITHISDLLDSFEKVLNSQKPVVDEGIEILREYDRRDTELRAMVDKYPATWPDAFFP